LGQEGTTRSEEKIGGGEAREKGRARRGREGRRTGEPDDVVVVRDVAAVLEDVAVRARERQLLIESPRRSERRRT